MTPRTWTGRLASSQVPMAMPIPAATHRPTSQPRPVRWRRNCHSCQILVTTVGTTIMAMAKGTSKKEARTGTATTGRPAPSAPLTRPLSASAAKMTTYSGTHAGRRDEAEETGAAPQVITSGAVRPVRCGKVADLGGGIDQRLQHHLRIVAVAGRVGLDALDIDAQRRAGRAGARQAEDDARAVGEQDADPLPGRYASRRPDRHRRIRRRR